ncbi:hypothetical protein BJX96DRAFT_31255 [Aspergillus floccosus]
MHTPLAEQRWKPPAGYERNGIRSTPRSGLEQLDRPPPCRVTSLSGTETPPKSGSHPADLLGSSNSKFTSPDVGSRRVTHRPTQGITNERKKHHAAGKTQLRNRRRRGKTMLYRPPV